MSCTGCNGGCDDCGGIQCGTGAAGLDGLNAFTETTGTFLQPAFGDPAIKIDVSAISQFTGIWAQVGQIIFIEGAGYFTIVTSTTTVITVIVPSATIQAINYAIAAGGSTIAIGSGVSPAGVEGPIGVTGPTGPVDESVIALDTTYTGGNTTTNAGLTLMKTTTIDANTLQSVGDILRVEIDVIGDAAPVILLSNYSLTIEFDGNLMFNFANQISQNANGIKLTIDICVTAINQVTPYVNYALGIGVRAQQKITNIAGGSGHFFDPALQAAITLSSSADLKIYLASSSGSNSVSITHYKVTKLLKP